MSRPKRGSDSLDDALAGLRASTSGQHRRLEKQAIAAQLFGDEVQAARIGRFTIVRSIGRGGMGEVFEARDPELDRLVAIKVMRRRRSTAAAGERFLREGRALARLSHTNIVQVHEVGEHDGAMFIAMEHITGRTLGEWIREDGPDLGWAEVVRVFLEAGHGLMAAHESGLVHRDFKPENVMIGEDGRVRVLDFGLARSVDTLEFDIDRGTTENERLAGSDESSRSSKPATDPERRVTETGMLLGTPAYMAPEQHRAEPASPASDQFSFCVALFEALHGVRPFAGTSRRELLRAIERGELMPTPQGGPKRVPKRVHRALRRGLDARPERRFASFHELDAALAAALRPRRAWVYTSVAALGLLAGFGLWRQAESGQRCTGAREQLVGVWDDAERERVRTAILATELPYAETTWARIEPLLDDYAQAWVDGHQDACEATRVREDQSLAVMDLRIACLDARRSELDAVVETLAVTDANTLDRAIELAMDLPSLDRCADLDALRSDLPPPEDAAVAIEVERHRAQLALLRARLHAGQIRELEREIGRLVETSKQLRYAPLTAEVALLHGEWFEASAAYPEAEAEFERAFLLASESDHAVVQADAAQWLVVVVGQRQAKLEPGLAWGKTALALALRPTASEEDEAKARTAIGEVQLARIMFDEANANFRAALRLREHLYGPDDIRVAESAGNLARMLYRIQLRPEMLAYSSPPAVASVSAGTLLPHRHRNLEAVELLDRALKIMEATLGPDHPGLIPNLLSLALILDELEERDEAMDVQTRALDIATNTRSDPHSDLAAALFGMGAAHQARGQTEQAQREFERGLEMLEATLEPSNPALADPLVRLCMIELERGRLDEAREHCERALDLREAAYGSDHYQNATPTRLLGGILRRQGDLVGARARLERGLEIAARLGPSSAINPVFEMAELDLAEGKLEAALDFANRALLSSEGRNDNDVVFRGLALFLRARVLAATPELAHLARDVAEEAREELRRDGRYPEDLAHVEAWLVAWDRTHKPSARRGTVK